MEDRRTGISLRFIRDYDVERDKPIFIDVDMWYVKPRKAFTVTDTEQRDKTLAESLSREDLIERFIERGRWLDRTTKTITDAWTALCSTGADGKTLAETITERKI